MRGGGRARRVAPILQWLETARLFSLPPMRAHEKERHEEATEVVMDKLKRVLMAALMCCVVSAGAFAQRRQDPKDPPPKNNPPRVKVEKDKDPPQDRREPRGNDNKRP